MSQDKCPSMFSIQAKWNIIFSQHAQFWKLGNIIQIFPSFSWLRIGPYSEEPCDRGHTHTARSSTVVREKKIRTANQSDCRIRGYVIQLICPNHCFPWLQSRTKVLEKKWKKFWKLKSVGTPSNFSPPPFIKLIYMRFSPFVEKTNKQKNPALSNIDRGEGEFVFQLPCTNFMLGWRYISPLHSADELQ